MGEQKQPRTWTLRSTLDGFDDYIGGGPVIQRGETVDVVEKAAYDEAAKKIDALEFTVRVLAGAEEDLHATVFRAESAEAEVVRLREALGQIVQRDSTGDHYRWASLMLGEAVDIARLALAGSPDERDKVTAQAQDILRTLDRSSSPVTEPKVTLIDGDSLVARAFNHGHRDACLRKLGWSDEKIAALPPDAVPAVPEGGEG